MNFQYNDLNFQNKTIKFPYKLSNFKVVDFFTKKKTTKEVFQDYALNFQDNTLKFQNNELTFQEPNGMKLALLGFRIFVTSK